MKNISFQEVTNPKNEPITFIVLLSIPVPHQSEETRLKYLSFTTNLAFENPSDISNYTDISVPDKNLKRSVGWGYIRINITLERPHDWLWQTERRSPRASALV